MQSAYSLPTIHSQNVNHQITTTSEVNDAYNALNLNLRKYACEPTKLKELQSILAKRASNNLDINAKGGESGMTALHRACLNANTVAIIELLNAGANPNILDNNNASPLNLIPLSHANLELKKTIQIFIQAKEFYANFKQKIAAMANTTNPKAYVKLFTDLEAHMESFNKTLISTAKFKEIKDSLPTLEKMTTLDYLLNRVGMRYMQESLQFILTQGKLSESCGQMAYILAAYLCHMAKIECQVETIIYNLVNNPSAGHEVVVLNRKIQEITRHFDPILQEQEWGAVIIDYLSDKVYLTGGSTNVCETFFAEKESKLVKDLQLNKRPCFINKDVDHKDNTKFVTELAEQNSHLKNFLQTYNKSAIDNETAELTKALFDNIENGNIEMIKKAK